VPSLSCVRHQALLARAVALRLQTGLAPAAGEPQWPGGEMGTPCTFTNPCDSGVSLPGPTGVTRDAWFPRAGAGKILPLPRRTQGSRPGRYSMWL
jgi:hypothetical protein